jgi:hypothetical protein
MMFRVFEQELFLTPGIAYGKASCLLKYPTGYRSGTDLAEKW